MYQCRHGVTRHINVGMGVTICIGYESDLLNQYRYDCDRIHKRRNEGTTYINLDKEEVYCNGFYVANRLISKPYAHP